MYILSFLGFEEKFVRRILKRSTSFLVIVFLSNLIVTARCRNTKNR